MCHTKMCFTIIDFYSQNVLQNLTCTLLLKQTKPNQTQAKTDSDFLQYRNMHI